jgi:hypothetical protein
VPDFRAVSSAHSPINGPFVNGPFLVLNASNSADVQRVAAGSTPFCQVRLFAAFPKCHTTSTEHSNSLFLVVDDFSGTHGRYFWRIRELLQGEGVGFSPEARLARHGCFVDFRGLAQGSFNAQNADRL